MYKLVHESFLDGANAPLEQLLDCLLGLSKLERKIFKCLLEHPNGEFCQEIATRVEKERSQIQKAIKHLVDAGLIERKQVPVITSESKIFKYIYAPVPRPAMRALLLSMIDETRRRMIQVVDDAFPLKGE